MDCNAASTRRSLVGNTRVGSGLPEFLKAAPETTSAEFLVGGTAMAGVHQMRTLASVDWAAVPC
ncbi:MAG: hypothetical protein D4S02_15165, partial [Rhodocyclaceae bacterium]